MYETKPIEGKVTLSGVFECRDKDGNILSTIEIIASMPLNQIEDKEIGRAHV